MSIKFNRICFPQEPAKEFPPGTLLEEILNRAQVTKDFYISDCL